MREIVGVHHAYDSDRFLVYASPAVAEALKGEDHTRWRKWKFSLVNRLKARLNRSKQEQVDVVMM
ncbi:hypothetical protein ACLK1T_15635 [Escherichia coli]